MPASLAPRCSPGRDKHKRGRSLENVILFKERDDDLALFNEVQTRERDNFLLQPNDDFEDTFVSKLRRFSDNGLGVNIPARGESSDLLNVEEEKNDYEWLITPPDTPLFPSLDDEAPQAILAQRGRSRTQPISISRSSTMEKSHRSSRGSASPNRLSLSPRSSTTVFQARGRASSAPSSSPPATLKPTTTLRGPSPPSSKPSTPARRASTPTPRRLSTGSTSTTGPPAAKRISPVKPSRGNSTSPKVKAWQANIPGFSTEAPPNLRTSLADRPASYVRGSSPASRNSRHSMSPTTTRSIASSHSHDRDRFSSHSKRSIASSGDDDVESLPSVILGSSERLNSRKVGGFRNNKAPVSQKASRAVSSSSAPKRSFDLALRQMDHKKGPQNMFRPLLSSVPSSTFYAGKASPAWNSSVTTSSNASSDQGTSGAHDIDAHDDANSGCVNVPDCDDDEVFMFEKTDSLNENTDNEAHDISGDFNGDSTLHSRPGGLENLADREVSNDFNHTVDFPEIDTLLCSRCGSRYSITGPTKEGVKLCADCRNVDRLTSAVVVQGFEMDENTPDKDRESSETIDPQTRVNESREVNREGEDLVQNGESTSNFLPESSLSRPQSEESDQVHPTIDVPNPKIDSSEKGISILLKRSSSVKGPVIRTGYFSASSISYDDLSYVRTNSMRSSVGRGSVSASSSGDFGPAMPTDTRFHRQSSGHKSDVDNNHKHRRSLSSLSGTSSRAFHPLSLGTSTLDSIDISITRTPQETPEENNNSTENENRNNVQVAISSTPELLPEFSNSEEPVEGSGNDSTALTTCTLEEGTSVNPCVDGTDVVEVALGVISEGELDHVCSSSAASQCDGSRSSDSSIEELGDPSVPNALDKDIAVSATDGDTSNQSSGITEESTVLVEGREGIKGKSLTLEEATDTILFCSSIVHNLAYEAATIALEKQSPPDPFAHNGSWPLVPAVENKNEPQNKNTSKRASKSKKSQKKTAEKDVTKSPNDMNTGEETDLSKPRIIFPNNKENTKPPKLESKCNCAIM